ncbi:hypothetical protein vseg_014480 [Gypsophila vaccaria]
MSMAIVARNRAVDTAMKAAFGSRSISSVSPRLLSPSSFSHNYSPLSPPNVGFRNVARSFSTDRHLDPYERFMRRTAINWGIRFVPQQEAFVIERFGKFHKVLEAGLHLLVPVVDQIAYIHSLKEQTIEISEQPAVTTDNVSIRVNGVLFVKVIDPEKASYGNDNAIYAVTQLAQTVMRSAIGKMPLDKTFMERETLNAKIVEAINDAAAQWGLVCRRYEIRDIIPPPGIRDSMVMQAEAERRKRAEIIEAEGKRQAVILTSEAAKINSILTSEGAKMNAINRAEGEAEAIRIVAKALQENGGQAAASLKVAQDYVQAFNKMAQESTTMLLPASIGDPSTMVASALALYKNLIVDKHGKNAFQEPSTPAQPARQIKLGKANETEEKPAFSLQSTKKD